MQPSMFNLRVPLEAGDEVFLMNTLTDAQLVVSTDVAALLDRAAKGEFVGTAMSSPPDDSERQAWDVLRENGFLVENRASDRRALDDAWATGSSESSIAFDRNGSCSRSSAESRCSICR